MARRTFVLDTSVILAGGAGALTAFAEHAVVLPLVVVKELEGKRNDPEIGFQARSALRFLEELRIAAKREGCDLKDAFPVNGDGGTIRIEINHVDDSALPDVVKRGKTNDVRILAVARALSDELKDTAPVTLVSRDLPMRFQAGAALDIDAEDYLHDKARDTNYSGIKDVELTTQDLDSLYSDGKLADTDDLPVNTGVVLRSPSSSALGIVGGDGMISKLSEREAFGVKGRTAPQRFALAHLLNDDVKIVSLGGKAGTGKSSLALAAGLELVMENKRFKRITVFRPLNAVGGQELGYLPGTVDEKMGPVSQAVTDALEGIATRDVIDEVTSRGLVDVQPLTHLRGRTLHDAFVIVDEAQNLERNVLLTALSRLGETSKVVLTHDVAQRDNLHVGRHDGVAWVVEKLTGSPLFAHVTLTKSERSAVAELVTSLLDSEG